MSWDNWITRNNQEWVSIEDYLKLVKPHFGRYRLKKVIAMYMVHNGVRLSEVSELTGISVNLLHKSMSFKLMQSSRIYRQYILDYYSLFNVKIGIKHISCSDLELWIRDNNLNQKTRIEEIRVMRQVAQYILATSYMMSQSNVGALFNRDRTTVIHSIKVVKNELKQKHSSYHNVYKQVKEELSCIL